MNNENWIPVDILPEKEDCYIIAWLPKGYKRKECFYAIANYDPFEGWDKSDPEKIIEKYWEEYPGVEIFAWRELPEPYIKGERKDD